MIINTLKAFESVHLNNGMHCDLFLYNIDVVISII